MKYSNLLNFTSKSTPSNIKPDDSNGEQSLILIESTLTLRIASNSCQIAETNPPVMISYFRRGEDLFEKEHNYSHAHQSQRHKFDETAYRQHEIPIAEVALQPTSDFPRLKQAPLVNSSQCHSASCRDTERKKTESGVSFLNTN